MKINKDLKWYAFYQDMNDNKLVYTNVLSQDLVEDILKRTKHKIRHIGCYDELKEAIKSYLMWRYWCRSEYEVIVSNWGGREMEEKIDIWYQLEPNLDRITEYVMKELKLSFKDCTGE